MLFWLEYGSCVFLRIAGHFSTTTVHRGICFDFWSVIDIERTPFSRIYFTPF
jgi:hypothetical protein